jgi:hypothetical protein
MKPCSKNRKPIAWLAMDILELREAAALRDHMAHCEGCRAYSEELSGVTERLAAANPNSNLEASAFFHQRVSENLRAAEPGSVLKNLVAWLRGSALNWRVATPATAALVIALLAIVAVRHQSPPSQTALHVEPVVSTSPPGSDPAPTIANYQIAAGQSLAALDDLLTRQGNKPLSPAPIFTASDAVLANASF